MYDELLKRLRERCVFLFPHHGESRSYDADLMHEAADAIEDLSAAVEGYESSTNMALVEKDGETIIEFQPKWIPVTERLPLLNTPVLATDGIEVDISWMYGVPPRWITSYTAIDEDKLTHWMPLPQTPKEET